jgi:hypothetical protein
MNNYIIPYGERHVRTGGRDITLMCVDNLGLVVYHKKDAVLTDDFIRHHLIGYADQHTTFIQANSLQEALQKFYDYPECKTGTKHKAWELEDSETRPIIEYCGCQFMNTRMGGCLECNYYDPPEEGGYMVCVLDGLDEPPANCPIDAQMSGLDRGWRSEVIQIGGVWVKRFSKAVSKMEPQINGILMRKMK